MGLNKKVKTLLEENHYIGAIYDDLCSVASSEKINDLLGEVYTLGLEVMSEAAFNTDSYKDVTDLI